MSNNDIEHDTTAEQEWPLQAPGEATEPRDPESAVSTTENGPEADDDQEEDDEHGGNREAAKYRKRLRDTEAERDRLADRLQTMQRAEAERLAGEHLTKGAALWIGGTELADVLDDDGLVDSDKVAARAEEVREEFGIRKPRSGLYVPAEGYNPDPFPSGGSSMVDVVMGNRH